MSVTINIQPASINAAYRPVYFNVTAYPTGSSIGLPPLVYCDVYFNGIFYKTFTKTNPISNNDFEFDISDAAQEYLKSNISPNGGTSILSRNESVVLCHCKFRSSITDTDGFIVPETPVPVQATSSQPATSGGGTQSNDFYIINATLQHDDSQDLTTHLNYFKSKTWDSTLFPLSHRPQKVGMYFADSDYFPVLNVGPNVITSLRLNYRSASSGPYQQLTNTPCVAVTAPALVLGTATVGAAFNKTLALLGSGPVNLSNITKPSWMSIAISGTTVTFSGTPVAGDVASNVAVSFTATNACGTTNVAGTVNVALSCVPVGIVGNPSLPAAKSGRDYSYSFNLSGTAPFTVGNISAPAWMSIIISGSTVQFGGRPSDLDITNSVDVTFDLGNCAGAGTASFSGSLAVGSAPQLTPGSNTTSGYLRTQVFTFGSAVSAGDQFYVVVYSHQVTVTAVAGDTPSSMAIKLANAVNATTEAQWHEFINTPTHGTPGFPPSASSSGNTITLILNVQNQFGAGTN